MTKRLKQAVKLNSKVTIYIPATTAVNTAVDNSTQVNAAAALLADLFGGSTSTPAVGYWMSDGAGLVRENTTLVFAYANTAALELGIDKVLDFCEQLKAEMSQEAIALEINGEMYFI